MTPLPDPSTYLARATGLPLDRAATVYRLGRTWPLCATHVTRRAAIWAQARGIPFREAFADMTRLTAAEDALILPLFARLEQTQDPAERQDILTIITAVPGFKEILAHCHRVARITREPFDLVYRFAYAIQLFAAEHPEWDPDGHRDVPSDSSKER